MGTVMKGEPWLGPFFLGTLCPYHHLWRIKASTELRILTGSSFKPHPGTGGGPHFRLTIPSQGAHNPSHYPLGPAPCYSHGGAGVE